MKLKYSAYFLYIFIIFLHHAKGDNWNHLKQPKDISLKKLGKKDENYHQVNVTSKFDDKKAKIIENLSEFLLSVHSDRLNNQKSKHSFNQLSIAVGIIIKSNFNVV